MHTLTFSKSNLLETFLKHGLPKNVYQLTIQHTEH